MNFHKDVAENEFFAYPIEFRKVTWSGIGNNRFGRNRRQSIFDCGKSFVIEFNEFVVMISKGKARSDVLGPSRIDLV
ncbi:MAG: hypothetical protein CM1200mP24_06750 [Gammaproteobacteria bacterium]|nr:MAG: hypothetical protein CM1200mP24_06750 [Gammaproteobacteria bacterium]